MKQKQLKDLFMEEEEGRIILPNFQREFVWEIKQQKELLATFLVELPISSILLLKGNPNDFNYRKLCFGNEGKGAKEDCFYLLDGQQRMSTLKSIFYNFFVGNWKKEIDDLYPKLRNMWFINVKRANDETEDIFGYENLDFKDENLKKFTPQEVVDNIEVYKVNKTKKKDWFYPANIIGDGYTYSSPKKEFINNCVEKGLVPLNGLIDNKKIQEKILNKIASDRVDEIIREIENEKDLERKKEKITQYFSEDFRDCLIENIDDFKACNDEKFRITYNWQTKMTNFLENLLKQEISLIEIQKNEISRGIAIFETINKGGTPLDNFDLIVAKAAKESNKEPLANRVRRYLQQDIELPDFLQIGTRKKWNASRMNLAKKNTDEISKKIKNQYLNLLSIFFHVGNDFKKLKLDIIKREKIFEVEAKEINDLTEKVVKSLLRALAFCNLRLGILELGEISYDLVLLTIAYLLSKDEVWNNKKALNKIEYWYWVSIFTGRYREKQNIRSIEDLKMLADWIIEKNEDNEKVKELLNTEKLNKVLTVDEYSDFETLKNSSKTPQAIFKGILSYVLSTNPFDLLSNQQRRLYDEVILRPNLSLEDHHLIPVGADKRIGGDLSSKIRNDKQHILNSVLNLTKISKEANINISNMKLDDYIARVDEICRIKHFIPKDLKIKDGESLEKYYERLLKERYNNIREELLTELHDLKN